MKHNHLEQLVAEWYELQGFFVRRNVHVGKRKEGGYHIPVFPVVHAKQWPLQGKLKDAYGKAHERCARDVQVALALAGPSTMAGKKA